MPGVVSLYGAVGEQPTPSKTTKIGPIPRLALLRRDLLDAPYGLCTQKAELLTAFMRAQDPPDPLGERAERLHFQAARRNLEQSLSTGHPQRRLQLRANRTLLAWEERRERRRPREPMVLRFARALAWILERVPLRIYEHELLVGNPSSHRIGAPLHPDYGGLLLLPELHGLSTRKNNPLRATPEQIAALEEEILPYWFPRCVQSRASLLTADLALPNELVAGRHMVLTQFAGIAHVTPDYGAVLSKGFHGLLAEAEAARATAKDPARAAHAEAATVVARAAIAFGARWSRHCVEAAAAETRPERAAELRRLAEILAWVPARPARTLHEALQSLVLAHVIVHQESFQHGVSFGRVDQLLWPYYRADLEAGRITPEGAVELIGCFLGKAAELLPLFNTMATEYFSGLSSASGLTIGGTDAEGRDRTNPVSFLICEAFDQLRLRQPNLHLRVHPKSDPALLARAAELLKGGGGMPAFFNDEAVVPALEALGVSPADARDYSVVGCVEWGVPGKSFPAAGAAFVNLPAALDRALHGGRHLDEGGHPVEFSSMEALFEAFSAELRRVVEAAVAGNDAIERTHARWRPTPYLSLLVQGCLDSGLDVTEGGARYDSTGMQGVGLADVADALTAIEQLVFQEGRISLPALMAAVDQDFAGAEALRTRILERVPKYGQDRGPAEGWARRVADRWCEEVRAHVNPRGGPYAPGFWTMTTHIGFGRRTGALPSGRKAGAPLADGISPTNGADRDGPTASLSAAARVGSAGVANGLCLNEKLDPWYLRGEAGTALLTALVRGGFAAGGMHVQVNVLDAAVLLDAKAHPERHRDLVVRISGYSAYFNDLTEAMKDDLIARTLHGAPPPGAGPACQEAR